MLKRCCRCLATRTQWSRGRSISARSRRLRGRPGGGAGWRRAIGASWKRQTAAPVGDGNGGYGRSRGAEPNPQRSSPQHPTKGLAEGISAGGGTVDGILNASGRIFSGQELIAKALTMTQDATLNNLAGEAAKLLSDGKEGVAGSSPAKGSSESPAQAGFSLPRGEAGGAETFPGPLLGRIRFVSAVMRRGLRQWESATRCPPINKPSWARAADRRHRLCFPSSTARRVRSLGFHSDRLHLE